MNYGPKKHKTVITVLGPGGHGTYALSYFLLIKEIIGNSILTDSELVDNLEINEKVANLEFSKESIAYHLNISDVEYVTDEMYREFNTPKAKAKFLAEYALKAAIGTNDIEINLVLATHDSGGHTGKSFEILEHMYEMNAKSISGIEQIAFFTPPGDFRNNLVWMLQAKLDLNNSNEIIDLLNQRSADLNEAYDKTSKLLHGLFEGETELINSIDTFLAEFLHFSQEIDPNETIDHSFGNILLLGLQNYYRDHDRMFAELKDKGYIPDAVKIYQFTDTRTELAARTISGNLLIGEHLIDETGETVIPLSFKLLRANSDLDAEERYSREEITHSELSRNAMQAIIDADIYLVSPGSEANSFALINRLKTEFPLNEKIFIRIANITRSDESIGIINEATSYANMGIENLIILSPQELSDFIGGNINQGLRDLFGDYFLEVKSLDANTSKAIKALNKAGRHDISEMVLGELPIVSYVDEDYEVPLNELKLKEAGLHRINHKIGLKHDRESLSAAILHQIRLINYVRLQTETTSEAYKELVRVQRTVREQELDKIS